jgi:ferritin-like metal-binding protein YciE
MEINDFRNMYLVELQELASAERLLADALPRMAKSAANPELKQALTDQRKQAQQQRDRIERILNKHGASPRAHVDQAMQALLVETEKMSAIVTGNELRDAALIASAQKLAHYEIAAYGTAAALAGQLELRDDQGMLHQSLEEKRQADAFLTQLAKGEVNREALVA